MSNLYDDEYEGVFSVLLVRHRGVGCFSNVFQVSDSNGTEDSKRTTHNALQTTIQHNTHNTQVSDSNGTEEEEGEQAHKIPNCSQHNTTTQHNKKNTTQHTTHTTHNTHNTQHTQEHKIPNAHNSFTRQDITHNSFKQPVHKI